MDPFKSMVAILYNQQLIFFNIFSGEGYFQTLPDPIREVNWDTANLIILFENGLVGIMSRHGKYRPINLKLKKTIKYIMGYQMKHLFVSDGFDLEVKWNFLNDIASNKQSPKDYIAEVLTYPQLSTHSFFEKSTFFSMFSNVGQEFGRSPSSFRDLPAYLRLLVCDPTNRKLFSAGLAELASSLLSSSIKFKVQLDKIVQLLILISNEIPQEYQPFMEHTWMKFLSCDHKDTSLPLSTIANQMLSLPQLAFSDLNPKFIEHSLVSDYKSMLTHIMKVKQINHYYPVLFLIYCLKHQFSLSMSLLYAQLDDHFLSCPSITQLKPLPKRVPMLEAAATMIHLYLNSSPIFILPIHLAKTYPDVPLIVSNKKSQKESIYYLNHDSEHVGLYLKYELPKNSHCSPQILIIRLYYCNRMYDEALNYSFKHHCFSEIIQLLALSGLSFTPKSPSQHVLLDSAQLDSLTKTVSFSETQLLKLFQDHVCPETIDILTMMDSDLGNKVRLSNISDKLDEIRRMMKASDFLNFKEIRFSECINLFDDPNALYADYKNKAAGNLWRDSFKEVCHLLWYHHLRQIISNHISHFVSRPHIILPNSTEGVSGTEDIMDVVRFCRHLIDMNYKVHQLSHLQGVLLTSISLLRDPVAAHSLLKSYFFPLDNVSPHLCPMVQRINKYVQSHLECSTETSSKNQPDVSPPEVLKDYWNYLDSFFVKVQ